MIRHFCIWVVKFYVTLFYHHKVYGKENLRKGGAIIASNHASFLDPPIIGVSYPGEVHFLARSSLFNFGPFGWLIRQLNTHPVTRGKENVSTFKLAVSLLQSQKRVVLFPEGHRSHDGSFQKGQLGISILVQKTGCMVVPTYVHGTYEIWNAHRKLPRLKGKTACVFGKPLVFEKEEGAKKEAQEKIAEAIMEKIKELQKWYLDGAKGIPP